MVLEEEIYQILVGRKVYTDGAWHVYNKAGVELSNAAGVLWRANPGALIMWPRGAGGGGPGPAILSGGFIVNMGRLMGR
jgi:hypothetical protein